MRVGRFFGGICSMAWIYLAESAESLSDYRNGSDRSPIVNLISTRGRFFSSFKWGGASQSLQSGEMSPRLEGGAFLSPWTSLVAASPARISALQEMESAWKESEAAFSLKSRDSLANYDRDSFSWKTSQLSLFGGLTAFSWSSLRWGMIVDGQLYQPANLAPHTCEKGGGYLPTPTASQYGSNQSLGSEKVRPSLQSMVRLPAPKVSRSSYSRQKNGTVSLDLIGLAGRWIPTPKSSDGSKGGPNCVFGDGSPQLPALAARFLPTPAARDYKDGLTPKRHGRHSPSVAVAVAEAGHPGYLNPRFVEVLMGYPVGWTNLQSWATQFVHRRWRKRLRASSLGVRPK